MNKNLFSSDALLSARTPLLQIKESKTIRHDQLNQESLKGQLWQFENKDFQMHFHDFKIEHDFVLRDQFQLEDDFALVSSFYFSVQGQQLMPFQPLTSNHLQHLILKRDKDLPLNSHILGIGDPDLGIQTRLERKTQFKVIRLIFKQASLEKCMSQAHFLKQCAALISGDFPQGHLPTLAGFAQRISLAMEAGQADKLAPLGEDWLQSLFYPELPFSQKAGAAYQFLRAAGMEESLIRHHRLWTLKPGKH